MVDKDSKHDEETGRIDNERKTSEPGGTGLIEESIAVSEPGGTGLAKPAEEAISNDVSNEPGGSPNPFENPWRLVQALLP